MDSPSRKRERETTLETVMHEEVQLCPTQREVLQRLVGSLDENTSVVITNAMQRDNPIVYVTKPWENMCGFSYGQAVGRNPRLTQGTKSDPAVIKLMSGALAQQQSCKVMMLNYRSGLEDRPFYNMLSISPVVHSGQLLFYLANLQDYSYHMSRLVSLSPSQFCRTAQHFMQRSRLNAAALAPRNLARPAILESNDDYALQVTPVAGQTPAAGFQMKRLGWSKLNLEPEHLIDRVVDCLQTMGARYELSPNTSDTDDLFIVSVEIRSVACRILVSRDPAEESAYRILCSRLGGDTFAYHDFFKELRVLLGDAVESGESLNVGGRRMLPAPLPAGLSQAPPLPRWGKAQEWKAQKSDAHELRVVEVPAHEAFAPAAADPPAAAPAAPGAPAASAPAAPLLGAGAEGVEAASAAGSSSGGGHSVGRHMDLK